MPAQALPQAVQPAAGRVRRAQRSAGALQWGKRAGSKCTLPKAGTSPPLAGCGVESSQHRLARNLCRINQTEVTADTLLAQIASLVDKVGLAGLAFLEHLARVWEAYCNQLMLTRQVGDSSKGGAMRQVLTGPLQAALAQSKLLAAGWKHAAGGAGMQCWGTQLRERR